MGIFDFFKSKKREVQPKEEEFIEFNGLHPWVGKKSLDLRSEKAKFNQNIKDSTLRLSGELRQGIISLNDINWEKIKAEERIKHIVRENTDNYILHLKELTSKLENIEEENLESNKIKSIFLDFDRKSKMNYQKSTFLIGKEFEKINGSVGKFFKDLDRLHDENKELLQNLNSLSNLKEKLEKLKSSDKIISGLENENENLEKNLKKLKKELESHEAKLDKERQGRSYLEWSEQNNDFENIKETLNKKMQMLASMIDFKALAKAWHKNPPEMEIIKRYKANFEEAFEKDKGEILKRVTNLLDNKETINKEVIEISDLERKIKSVKLNKDPSLPAKEKIDEFQNGILKLQEKKASENNKINKLNSARENLLQAIKKDLETFGVQLS